MLMPIIFLAFSDLAGIVAYASLIERRLNFEVVTKKLIHDEVEILG